MTADRPYSIRVTYIKSADEYVVDLMRGEELIQALASAVTRDMPFLYDFASMCADGVLSGMRLPVERREVP